MPFCGTLCKPRRLALSRDAESLAGGGRREGVAGGGGGGGGEGAVAEGGWLPFRKMQNHKQENEEKEKDAATR